MKYPQLVSTRAVNAISDWLVSRLEQLGVEAPQIYARFLLSLLQSSVQINDPIEYNNLETFIANRKGNNRRLHQLLGDSETLKKLTAVQCLQGIVAADQEISNIENLVDELCTKLKEIEEQNADIGADAAGLLLTPAQQIQIEQAEQADVEGVVVVAEKLKTRAIARNRIRSLGGLEKTQTQAQRSSGVERKNSAVVVAFEQQEIETETDPKKRYFRAFPALSKDMDEESFRALRQHAKSLTWPVERYQSVQLAAQIAQNSSDSSSSSSHTLSQTQTSKSAGEQAQHNKSNSSQEARTLVKSATNVNVKRRSRRRRNQALKNKSMQQKCNSKSSTIPSTTVATAVETGSEAVVHKGKRKQRYTTPTYWDTDFEGCWEMGRDLIKEFITKQNHRINRNRSTSESAAYALKAKHCEHEHAEDEEAEEEEEFLTADLSKFCYDNMKTELEDQANKAIDALDTVSELAIDEIASLPLVAPRRLYERDICAPNPITEEETEADFAQFKAKFDSNVEALWKDVEPMESVVDTATHVSRDKLKSFWSHYFQDQFTTNAAVGFVGESMSLTKPNSQPAETSDYYSMPNNWDEVDKALPRKMPPGFKPINVSSNTLSSGTDSITPVGVFLNTNSIWSEPAKPISGGVVGGADTADSFYYKIWNGHQLDSNPTTGQQMGFPPISVSKWSEGINAGPTTTMSTNLLTLPSNNLSYIDGPDSSTTGSASASTTSCSSAMYPWPHHWQTPGVIGQFAPHVMSLTDMYAHENIDHSNTSSSANSSLNSPAMDSRLAMGPKVTLVNHAVEGKSAFVEYARMKTFVKNTNIPQVRKTYANAVDLMRNSNENLLTSDITHFQPIRSYRDGHVFNICSAWDAILYERSASGYLCLGVDKYLEYKRNDNYAAEDDAVLAARAGNASTAPLYASSNCDAATSMRQQQEQQQQQQERKHLAVGSKQFALKFRVLSNCEIGCQTENAEAVAAAAAADAAAKDRINALKLTEQHPLCLLFAGGARQGMQPRPIGNTGAACSGALVALNIAIATAAKTRMQQEQSKCLNNNNNNEGDWLPATKVAQHVAAEVKNEMYQAKTAANCWPSEQNTNFMWPIYQAMDVRGGVTMEGVDSVVENYSENTEKGADGNEESSSDDDDEQQQQYADDVDDATCCEEVDYCMSGKKSPWSMRAIGKKCQLNEQTKRKRLNVNNNNTDDRADANGKVVDAQVDDDEFDHDNDDDDEHTLWGMCAACHSENKSLSLPANRLLRDELNQEADEIMNELKNMQDLYIGRDATESDDGNDEVDSTTQKLMDVDKMLPAFKPITGNWCDYSAYTLIKQQQLSNAGEEKPNKVLQQMNRFIEDWLRPSTFQGEKYDFWHTNKVKVTCENDENVVIVHDKNNIWQTKEEVEMQFDDNEAEHVNDDWKPRELLRQLNIVDTSAQPNNNNTTAVDDDDDAFLSKLSWEHEHLAAIWKNATPLPTGMDKWATDEKNYNKTQTQPQSQQEHEQQRDQKSLEIEKQQSERVKAFLQHLGLFNKKIDRRSTTIATTTTNNTPKIIAGPTTTMAGNRKRRHSESINYLELVEEHALFPNAHNHDNSKSSSSSMKLLLFNNNNNSSNNKTIHNLGNNTDGNDDGTGERTNDMIGIDEFFGNMKTKLLNMEMENDDNKDLANDYDNENDGNNVLDYEHGNVAENDEDAGNIYNLKQQQQQQQQEQTIITCNYWATIADNNNKNNNNNNQHDQNFNNSFDINNELINSFAMEEDDAAVATAPIAKQPTKFNCQYDKNNASILRHVTTAMVARPLTR